MLHFFLILKKHFYWKQLIGLTTGLVSFLITFLSDKADMSIWFYFSTNSWFFIALHRVVKPLKVQYVSNHVNVLNISRSWIKKTNTSKDIDYVNRT